MAMVNDEVVEVGLQPLRGPAPFDRPSAGSARDGNPAEAASSAVAAGGDQDVAIRGQGRLHDGDAFPRLLPKLLAVSWRDAGRAGSAQQQDLRNSVDRQ